MSKIGKLPITIPAAVTIVITDRLVTVTWPKWELSYEVLPCVVLKQEDTTLEVSVKKPEDGQFRGLTRTLINNMVLGVTEWYQKKLKIIGVGYAAQVQGSELKLKLGFSHPVDFPIPQWITMSVEVDPKGHPVVTINGTDKQLVGEVSAKIRAFRKPEPYKGKWVRYFDEVVKLKPGKSAK